MRILKFIGFVVLSLCIFSYTAQSASQTKAVTKMESNVQISDLQTQKKITILNTLEKEDLILTEVKKLRKDKQEDVVCLALNMYHEARGSSVKDQIATTYVVFNRYESGNYPLTLVKNEHNLCNIIFDRWQFCWTNGNVIPKPNVKLHGEKIAWEKAQRLALELYNNPIHRQLAKEFKLQHYVVTPLLYDSKRPKWIDKRQLTIQIGKHSYMSLKEGIIHNNKNITKYSKIIDRAYNIIFNKNIKNLNPSIRKIK